MTDIEHLIQKAAHSDPTRKPSPLGDVVRVLEVLANRKFSPKEATEWLRVEGVTVTYRRVYDWFQKNPGQKQYRTRNRKPLRPASEQTPELPLAVSPPTSTPDLIPIVPSQPPPKRVDLRTGYGEAQKKMISGPPKVESYLPSISGSPVAKFTFLPPIQEHEKPGLESPSSE